MPVSQKSPATPMTSTKIGERTSDKAKVMPIEDPTRAMALVRTRSRTESDNMAVTAAETAPAPCSARPAITVQTESPSAAAKLPTAKIRSPAAMTGLRPKRSLAAPKGICRQPWVSP